MASAAHVQKKSIRMQHRFWLDISRQDEHQLDQYVVELKADRAFSSTIKNALRLIRDLRNQRLDVLFELFPWLNAWLEDRAQAIARTMIKSDQDTGGGGEGSDPIIARLDRIEQLVTVQATSVGGGGMLMSARESVRALPAGDDPKIEISQAKYDPLTNNPTFNFLISTAALGGDFSGLSNDILEYGIRNGRIDSKWLTTPKLATTKPKRQRRQPISIDESPLFEGDTEPTQVIDPILEAPTPGNARPLAGAGVMLAAPTFDDLDSELAFS